MDGEEDFYKELASLLLLALGIGAFCALVLSTLAALGIGWV